MTISLSFVELTLNRGDEILVFLEWVPKTFLHAIFRLCGTTRYPLTFIGDELAPANRSCEEEFRSRRKRSSPSCWLSQQHSSAGRTGDGPNIRLLYAVLVTTMLRVGSTRGRSKSSKS